jgi:hypothetical protein
MKIFSDFMLENRYDCVLSDEWPGDVVSNRGCSELRVGSVVFTSEWDIEAQRYKVIISTDHVG